MLLRCGTGHRSEMVSILHSNGFTPLLFIQGLLVHMEYILKRINTDGYGDDMHIEVFKRLHRYPFSCNHVVLIFRVVLIEKIGVGDF